MKDNAVVKRKVTLLHSSPAGVSGEAAEKELVSEISLKILINEKPLLSLLCFDQYLEELAVGFLFCEGIIDSIEDVKAVEFNKMLYTVSITLTKEMDIRHLEGLKSMTSGCGRGITYINPGNMEDFEELDDSFQIPAELIWETMKSFNTRSELYRKIGGVHSALLRCVDLSLFAEDIGRHNCFDKIAGMLLKDHGLSGTGQSVLFTSGRISSEIVTKIVRLKAPILVSRSAPTAAAVELAEEYNVTLLGYVRGNRGIVYTGEERIIL